MGRIEVDGTDLHRTLLSQVSISRIYQLKVGGTLCAQICHPLTECRLLVLLKANFDRFAILIVCDVACWTAAVITSSIEGNFLLDRW